MEVIDIATQKEKVTASRVATLVNHAEHIFDALICGAIHIVTDSFKHQVNKNFLYAIDSIASSLLNDAKTGKNTRKANLIEIAKTLPKQKNQPLLVMPKSPSHQINSRGLEIAVCALTQHANRHELSTALQQIFTRNHHTLVLLLISAIASAISGAGLVADKEK